jgi:hypothetical protein
LPGRQPALRRIVAHIPIHGLEGRYRLIFALRVINR